jgi:hypothetical protein
MLDDDFNRQRALLIRELASRADPFIKRRLLDLAFRYEKPQTTKQPILPPTTQNRYDHKGGGDGA